MRIRRADIGIGELEDVLAVRVLLVGGGVGHLCQGGPLA
jgi:hypothetical protein